MVETMNRKRGADEVLAALPDKRPYVSINQQTINSACSEVRATSSPIMDVPLSDFARISPAMRSPCSKKPTSSRTNDSSVSSAIISGTGSGLGSAIMSPRAFRRSKATPMGSPAVLHKSKILVPEIEEYSRLRLSARKVPALTLRQHMDQKTFYSIPNIILHYRKKDTSLSFSNWVTIGVVLSVSSYLSADNSSSTPYFSFTFTAASDHSMRVFLVTKGAIEKWQDKLKFGDVIGLLNPGVMKPSDPKALLGLKVEDGNQILPIGTSFDIVRCRHVNNKGEQCKRIIKRSTVSASGTGGCVDGITGSQQEYCDSHLLRQLQSTQRRRQELAVGTSAGLSSNEVSSPVQQASSLPARFLASCRSSKSLFAPKADSSPAKSNSTQNQLVYTLDNGESIKMLREAVPSVSASALPGSKSLMQDNSKVIDILCRQPNAGGKYLRAAAAHGAGNGAFASPSAQRRSSSISDVFSAKDLKKMGFHPNHKTHLGVLPSATESVAASSADGMVMCSPMKSPGKYATINQSHILSPSAMRRGPSLAGLGNVTGRRLFGGASQTPSAPAGMSTSVNTKPASASRLADPRSTEDRSSNPFFVGTLEEKDENRNDDMALCSPFVNRKKRLSKEQPLFVDLESSGDEDAEDMILQFANKPRA